VQHIPCGYDRAPHLAAAIIATNDGPDDRTSVRRRHHDEIDNLSTVALRNLRHARDDGDFTYGLQTIMAFEDGGVAAEPSLPCRWRAGA